MITVNGVEYQVVLQNGGATHRVVIDGRLRGSVFYRWEPTHEDIVRVAADLGATLVGECVTDKRVRASGAVEYIGTWSATVEPGRYAPMSRPTV